MPKRFTDTDKWKKDWIKKLSVEYKLFWVYLLDECNHAGIWDVEIDVVNMRLGTKISLEGAISALSPQVVPFNNGAKWFIPKFIEFQYGELSTSNKVHLSVINLLKKQGLYKGHTSPLQRPKDKEKEKDKDKEKENIYGEFVRMTETEHTNLAKKLGDHKTAEYIEKLDNYIGSKGKKYKSHYRTILMWAQKDGIGVPKERTKTEVEAERTNEYLKSIGAI